MKKPTAASTAPRGRFRWSGGREEGLAPLDGHPVDDTSYVVRILSVVDAFTRECLALAMEMWEATMLFLNRDLNETKIALCHYVQHSRDKWTRLSESMHQGR